MIRDLFEDKSKQSGEFDNEVKVGRDDAKKIAKNYGVKWDVIDKDTWILTDAGEHVMTYMPKKGELYSDFDDSVIIDMIKNR